MSAKERRRHFLVNKPLQIRYMLTISLLLIIVTFISLASFYFGLWGDILRALTNEQLRNDLLTATRLQQYEESRYPQPGRTDEAYSFNRQVERLRERQQDVLKGVLDQTNQNLIAKLAFLFFLIAMGTIFLSHKIAGPLYRFQKVLDEMERGNLTVRCHLRKFDEAMAVGDSFNRVLQFFDSAIGRVKKITQEDEKNPDRLRSRLNEELSKFKTST